MVSLIILHRTIFLLYLITMGVLATGEDDPRHISLLSRVIDTRTEPGFRSFQHSSRHFMGLSADELQQHPMPTTFLVHINRTEDDDVRERISAAHNVVLDTYVPHNTFVVLATHAQAASMESMPGVLWVGNLASSDKISQTIMMPMPSSSPNEFIPPPTAMTHPMFNITISSGVVSPEDAVRLTDITDETAPNETAVVEPPAMIVSLTATPNARSSDEVNAVIDRLRYDLLVDERSQLLYHVDINAVREDRLRLELRSERDLLMIAEVLADDPDVLFVERRMTPKFLNRWSRGIIQNGLTTSADYMGHSPPSLMSWDHGLNGEGQIIGLADSGIDYRHCFFHDMNRWPPFKAHKSAPTSADISPSDFNHRKLIQYVVYGHAGDDSGGHGTHTAGTIAGAAVTGATRFNPYEGLVPNSKLAFFDLGKSDGSLMVPDDLTGPFLHWSYLAGARLHSNSWGVSTPYYTSSSRDVDQYMWDHKDFLVVFAAGNDGSCRGEMTLGAPATAKNIISVGAGMTNIHSYTTTGIKPPYYTPGGDSRPFDEHNIAGFSSRGPTVDMRIKPDLIAPGYNTVSAKVGSNTCQGALGSILSVKSGTSMATPALTGNLAMIRQYYLEGFYPSGQRNPAHGFNPSASLVKATAIAAGTRMKGYRLVTDRFMTTATRCAAPQLVSIAQQPGIDQGWGRLELDTALRFTSPTTRRDSVSSLYLLGFNPRQKDTFGDYFIYQRQTHTYRICAFASSSLPPPKIVLVWTDPPAQQMSSVQLVNNLDLEVFYEQTNRIHLGNAGVYRGGGPDARNPVEAVVLEPVKGADADIRVVVRARAINVGGAQPYSLVVTGPLRPMTCAQSHRMDQNQEAVQLTESFARDTMPKVGGPPMPQNVEASTTTTSNEDSSAGISTFQWAATSLSAITVIFVASMAGRRWKQSYNQKQLELNSQIQPTLSMTASPDAMEGDSEIKPDQESSGS